MAERRRRRDAPFLEARAGLESGTSLGLRRLERVYRNHARDLASRITKMRVEPSSPRGQARMNALIDEQVKRLASSLDQLVTAQVRAGAQTAMDAAAESAKPILGQYFSEAQIDRVFTRMAQQVAEQQLADGRVRSAAQRAAESWKQAAQKSITYATKANPPPAQMGRTIGSYLSPGNVAVKRQLHTDAGAPTNPLYAGTRLAETELQTAYHNSLVQAGNATPSYRGVDWKLSPRHAKVDICDELVGFHPAGEEPDKPHPHCRCIIIPRYETAASLDRKLKRWVDDRSSEPEIERWYLQHADILGKPAKAA